MSAQEVVYLSQAKVHSRTTGARKAREVKDRKLTVSYIHFDQKRVPYIRLSGPWLKRLGFQSGQKVIVREQPGILVIQLAEEATA